MTADDMARLGWTVEQVATGKVYALLRCPHCNLCVRVRRAEVPIRAIPRGLDELVPKVSIVLRTHVLEHVLDGINDAASSREALRHMVFTSSPLAAGEEVAAEASRGGGPRSPARVALDLIAGALTEALEDVRKGDHPDDVVKLVRILGAVLRPYAPEAADACAGYTPPAATSASKQAR